MYMIKNIYFKCKFTYSKIIYNLSTFSFILFLSFLYKYLIKMQFGVKSDFAMLDNK